MDLTHMKLEMLSTISLVQPPLEFLIEKKLPDAIEGEAS